MTEYCPPELEGANVVQTEDLLGHDVRNAFGNGTSLEALEATCSPTTSHTVGRAMLAFVDH